MTRLVLFILAFFSATAFAGPVGKAGPSVVSKGGNVWEVVYGSGNTVSTTRTWSAGADAGSLILADVVEATIANSKKAQMVVRSPVAAAAVGRVAAKLLPIVGPASLAYDVWTELRCKFEDGQIKCDPGIPGTVPTFPAVLWWPNGDQSYARTQPGSACQAYSGAQAAGCTTMSYDHTRRACTATCTSGYQGEYAVVPKCPAGYDVYESGDSVSCAPKPGTPIPTLCADGSSPSPFDGLCPSGNYVPKSEDEAGDHFGKNAPKLPNWSEKGPGIVEEGQDKGLPVDAGKPQVSGPPSVQGNPSVTTQNKPDGSVVTITNTPTYNITYQGNTYHISTVNNTTTNTTNVDGSTTTETTTEQPDPESVAPPSDPDMPAVPTLYEKKYPDGPSGVWATRKAQLQTTPIFSFLASLVPSTGDGGCPSWQLPVMYGIKNTSVVDISIPCWIWSAIRAIFVVTALFSCRRIIFGG